MKTIWMFFLLLIFQTTCLSDTLLLNVDERYWYPFTYKEKNSDNEIVAKGMHVDIVKAALKNLGYTVKIDPLPKIRCIIDAINGRSDGIISISFSKDLQNDLEFPPDTNQRMESQYRIMQVDHMVITYKNNPYEFDGKVTSLPVPVRVPRGESIIAELKSNGLQVEEAREDRQNFLKLIRDKKGTIITTSIFAENMNNTAPFKDQFIIHSIPLVSQSYFLVFSKKTTLNQNQKQRIWDEIARIRDDYVFMLQLFAQY